jgi:hypothetical protein
LEAVVVVGVEVDAAVEAAEAARAAANESVVKYQSNQSADVIAYELNGNGS